MHHTTRLAFRILIFITCARMCVCVCVYACVRAYVCACVCIFFRFLHRPPSCSSWSFSFPLRRSLIPKRATVTIHARLSPSLSLFVCLSVFLSLSLFLSLDVSVGEVIAFRWRRSGGPRSLGGLVCYFTPEGTFSFVFQRNMHQPQAVRKDGLISIGGVKKMMHDRIR